VHDEPAAPQPIPLTANEQRTSDDRSGYARPLADPLGSPVSGSEGWIAACACASTRARLRERRALPTHPQVQVAWAN
jgi:hypothetical protein